MKYQYKKIKWIYLLLLLAVQFAARGQGRSQSEAITYNGVITDRNNVGISGVTVEVQEKDNATTTNSEGKFSITTESSDVLVLKKEGFLTTLYPLNRNASFKFSLESTKAHAGEQDDVEIPFTTRKGRFLTSAVSSLKAEDLPQPSTSALTNVLSGRLAGLNVLQLDTKPGYDISTFQVRGLDAFGRRNALVLVDGVEREFQDLDLNEIESVSVLKDAASLAWYGLRGSNGVVLVTTKKGSATANQINFNAQVGVQEFDYLISPLNAYDYATLYNEARLNDNPAAGPLYDQAALDAYKNGTDPYRFPNNNYVNEFLSRSAPIQRYVASTSGGSSRVRYFALLGYLNQAGIFENTAGPNYNSNNGYQRFNFRGNIDFDVTNSLTVSVKLGGRAELRTGTGSGNNTDAILNSIYDTRPNAYPVRNANGSFGGNAEFPTSNILARISNSGYRTDIQRVGLSNFMAKQKLDVVLKGLSANIMYSYDTQGDYAMGRTESFQTYDLSNESNPLDYGSPGRVGYLNTSFNNALRSNELWAGFDFDRSFGNHEVNASVRGMQTTQVAFDEIDQRMQGLSGRVEYGFKQKYLLGLTAGYYGDDDLPAGNRYGFFPAVSAGWIVSEEGFLAGNSFLSYLKLRASHGQVGNSGVDFGMRFPYRTAYNRNATGGGYQFGTGFSATNMATETNIGNPFVTYETVTITNAGIDFDLFNGALTASADIFKNRRTGILTTPGIPAIIGQAVGLVNEGIVKNNGFESSLFYNKQLGQFKLSLNGNILVSSDEVEYQGGQEGLPEAQNSKGHIVSSSLVYLSEGIYQSQDEINAHGVTTSLSGKLTPGDIRYKDVNGDKTIDALDRVRLDKRETPGTYFGFGTILKYKIFDLNAQFMGTSGRTINIIDYVNAGPNGFNQETFNRWTPTTAASAIYPRIGLADQGHNRATSDFWLRDGDYVKLRTVELGISLPESLAGRIKTQGLRLYVSAYNALTFSNLNLNVDPEIPYAGRIGSAYPYARTYSVGLNVKF